MTGIIRSSRVANGLFERFMLVSIPMTGIIRSSLKLMTPSQPSKPCFNPHDGDYKIITYIERQSSINPKGFNPHDGDYKIITYSGSFAYIFGVLFQSP